MQMKGLAPSLGDRQVTAAETPWALRARPHPAAPSLPLSRGILGAQAKAILRLPGLAGRRRRGCKGERAALSLPYRLQLPLGLPCWPFPGFLSLLWPVCSPPSHLGATLSLSPYHPLLPRALGPLTSEILLEKSKRPTHSGGTRPAPPAPHPARCHLQVHGRQLHPDPGGGHLRGSRWGS